MKVVKRLVVIVVSLLVAMAVYLSLFFNLNDLKPQLIQLVADKTGRVLTISEDISWSVYPRLGIEVGGVSLSNPDGFAPAELLQANQVVASIALKPLIDRKIKISTLTLDGLVLNVVTQANGKNSFDGLNNKDKLAEAKPADKSPTDMLDLESINIEGINITDTKVSLINHKTKTEQHIALDSFTLGQFNVGQDTDLAYSASVESGDTLVKSSGKGTLNINQAFDRITLKSLSIDNSIKAESLPNKQLDIALQSDIDIQLNKQILTLQLTELTANDLQASGTIHVGYGNKIPLVSVSMDFNDINLDSFLASEDTNAAEQQLAAEIEPDLSVLKTIDVKLAVTAKSITLDKLKSQDWKVNVTAKNGILTVDKLVASLYKGSLSATAKLDASQDVPRYEFTQSLTNVQLLPLLTELADIKILAGAANINVTGNGSSLISNKVKNNLVANGQFEVADGALYGVNIPQMLRTAEQKLTGNLSAKDDQELKTDFSRLAGTFSLINGIVTNPDLTMAAPLLRVSGQGTADINQQLIDYHLITRVVNTLTGQGEGEDSALKGIDIPIAIGGTFTKPTYKLDTDKLLKEKLKQETDKVKGKLEDKLKSTLLEKLGGL